MLVLWMLLVPAIARADAIDGPPACPPGARGTSSHSGTACVLAECATDADCAELGPWQCVERRMCTLAATVPMGGHRRTIDEAPRTFDVTLVVASCAPSETCTGTEEPWPPSYGVTTGTPTCATRRVCVAPALPSIGEFLGVEPAPPTPATPPAPGAAPSTPTTPAPRAAPAAAPEEHGCAAHAGRGALLPAALVLLAALGLSRRRP
jgi:hypothetical protein